MTRTHWGAFALGLVLLPSAVVAQDAAPAAAVEGARSYTPADFARFKPHNALDMLKHVPGFVIRAATQERGLGQATGNVLLNGQRQSGKSNDVLAELGRIPAGNVIRIEIVDGATLAIPGLSGPVANVVAKAEGISGQWNWRPEFRAYYTDPLLTRGEVSLSGVGGAFQYNLGLQNGASHSGAGGPTEIFGPDRSLREQRQDEWTGEYDAPKLSGGFSYDGPGGSKGNLNASYQRVYYDFVEVGRRSGPGLVDRIRDVGVEEGGYNHEVGGDYAFALGAGQLKLIGLNRQAHIPVSQTVTTRFADGSPTVGSRFTRVSDERERIARGEYRWTRGPAEWQLSAEAAFNSLDGVSELFVLDADGDFVGVPLPGGTATVEEDRYEIMGSYGRPLSSSVALQLSAGGEHSNLRQLGAGGLSRTFVRPKGLASIAWKARPDLDVNLKLQRKVGQLNFGDFLASVNLSEERENAGNPELVPQQSWDLDLEATRDLGAYGTTSVRLYGRWIDDIVDIVPIGDSGESPGNIDRATAYGVEWKGTLQFDPLGWPGAKLDARLQLQDTRVDDPLTGQSRPISNSLMRLAETNFRRDVPEAPWAYGASLSYQYAARNYRLTEVGRQWEGPLWGSVFLEHKDVFGLTMRATVGNLFGAMSMWDRTVYTGRRTGPVDFYERRDRRIGPIFSFSVSGRF